jgi:predicted nucleotidyltransferase
LRRFAASIVFSAWKFSAPPSLSPLTPAKSDLDFVVQFGELAPGEYADTYFGLLEEMEKLFQRRVDLIMDTAIDNPYFREKIEKTGVLLFAA